jgi:hypothetical protein
VTRAQVRNIVTLPNSVATDVERSQVIAKIERIFEQILDKIADDSTATELLIPFWTRPVWLPGRSESSRPSFHWVKFPGDTLAEAKKFGRSGFTVRLLGNTADAPNSENALHITMRA